MSVGHGGNESKHSGLEKLFILEWLQARLDDVADDYNRTSLGKDSLGNPETPVSIEVFDPYNTDMDFFVLVKANRPTFNETYKVYEGIYAEYHKRKLQATLLAQGKTVKEHEKKHKTDWKAKKNMSDQDYDTMKKKCFEYDDFHASISKTMMFYSIDQMAKLYGEERIYT